MNHRFSRITAALALAVLAGMMTACGSAGVTSSNAPDVQPDQTSAPETTAEEISTQTEADSDKPAQDISIPDGKIPDVTVPEIHIDMPDVSVPDINEYMYGTTDTATKGTAAQSPASGSDEIQTITDVSGDFSYTGTLFQGGDDKNGYIKVPTDFVNFVDYDVNGLTQYSDATRKNIITLAHHEGIDYKTAADNLRSQKEKQTDLKNLEGATVTIADYHALQLYGRYDDGIYVVDWFIEDPADPADSTYFLAMEFDSEHDYMLACSSTFQTIEDHNRS